MPRLLLFVEKSDPVLRETMPKITDFNDAALHETINDMCYSIMPAQLREAQGVHTSAAGMAANQWGIKQRVFIFTPEGSGEDKPLEVMLNPSYIPYIPHGSQEPEMVSAYEGCFSIPLTTAIVDRYESILATYYTIKGKKMERVMHGWEARVFQHETDHLNGKLFDGKLDHHAGPDCRERIIFGNRAEMDAFWRKK